MAGRSESTWDDERCVRSAVRRGLLVGFLVVAVAGGLAHTIGEALGSLGAGLLLGGAVAHRRYRRLTRQPVRHLAPPPVPTARAPLGRAAGVRETPADGLRAA